MSTYATNKSAGSGGGGSGTTTVGTIDSQAPSANGGVIAGTTLYFQSASGTAPGLVNDAAQSFAGAKTFLSTITATNLSGTNTGDVTLGTVPASLTLVGQVLSLAAGSLTDVGTDGIVITGGANAVLGSGTSIAQAAASGSQNGYLSSANFTTFSSKVGSLTVASANGFAGTSSGGTTPALTLSTTVTGLLLGNGTAVSAAPTTGAGNVVLSTSPTMTGTVNVTNLVGSGTISGTNLTSGGHAILDLAIANNLSDVASKTASFDNLSPMTTAGDIIVGGTAGTGTRLAVGSATQFLKGGTTPTYATAVTSVAVTGTNALTVSGSPITTSGTIALSPASVTITNSNLTVTAAMSTMLFDVPSGAITATLPTAVAINGRIYTFKVRTTAGGTLTVATTSSQTIDGSTTVVLTAVHSFITVESDGSNWQIIGQNSTTSTTVAPSITRLTTGSGTYTTPVGAVYLRVKMVGGGGGGGTDGNNATAGTNGISCAFGAGLLSVGGGFGGVGGGNGGTGGAGGAVNTTAGTVIESWSGQAGAPGFEGGIPGVGATGGSSRFGGGGPGGPAQGGAGVDAVALTGSGGGGSSNNATGNNGGGGGAGAYLEVQLTSLASSYAYSTGVGGAGASASGGSGAFADGGHGADGIIIVEAYF